MSHIWLGIIGGLILLYFRDGFGMSLTNKHASLGQFPYMIYLSIEKTPSNSFSCGGSVLTKNFGLTAGHCLSYETPENETKYALAAHAFMGIVDLLGPQETEIYRRVSEMIVHEKYQLLGNEDYTYHDIGLIRFEFPIEFCDRVQPITLPYKYQNRTFVGKIGTGMGWGMTVSGNTSSDLLFTNSRVISNSKCQKKYNKSTRISYDVTDGMICVTPTGDSPRGGACAGDSGGPIVLRNTSLIFGIASWTEIQFDNCTKPFPDVFTRVTHYLDWIRAKVGPDEEWFGYGTNITNVCPIESVYDEEETESSAINQTSEGQINVINEISTKIIIN